MSMIEAIKAVLNATSSYGGANSARDTLHGIVAAYDALAPDWAQAPDWAKWYAIDANGSAAWYKRQPKYDEFCDTWLFSSGSYVYEHQWANEKGDIAIPVGIDWRLCKWQRPEVTP